MPQRKSRQESVQSEKMAKRDRLKSRNVVLRPFFRLFAGESRREQIELLVIFLICFIIAFVIGLCTFSGRISLDVLGAGFARLPTLTAFNSGNKNTVAVYDPYVLYQEMISKPSQVLVIDVRSSKEYKLGHLKTALSYPFYASLKNVGDKAVKANDFADFVARNSKSGQQVIVYGYSQYSKSARDAVIMLNKQGIDASLLGVGWNEWDHIKTLWVPEGAWDSVDVNRTISLPD